MHFQFEFKHIVVHRHLWVRACIAHAVEATYKWLLAVTCHPSGGYCQNSINPFQFLYSTSVGTPATHLAFSILTSVYNMALKASSEVSRLSIIYSFKITKCAKKIINSKSNVNSNWVLSIENGYKYVLLRFKSNFEYAKKKHENIKLYWAIQFSQQVFVCSGTPKIVREENNS